MKFKLLITMLLGMFITIYACQKQDHASTPTDTFSPFSAITSFFTDLGFKASDVQVMDSVVVLEGDMAFSMEQVNCAMNGCNDTTHEVTDRQRTLSETSLSDAVANSRVSNIKIALHPMGDSYYSWTSSARFNDWNTILNQSIGEYNILFSTDASSLKFVNVTNNSSIVPDIVVFPTPPSDMPWTDGTHTAKAIGRADFPGAGYAGGSININRDIITGSNYSYYYKVSLLMHEMGHTIGLHHTNLTSGTHIPNTPTSDTWSVMNQGTSQIEDELSSGDVKALMTLYPYSLNVTPVINSVSKIASGKVRLNITNPQYNTKPFYWVEVIKYNSTGTQELSREQFRATHNGTGTQNIDWSGHAAGTYRFRVKGLNFRRDKGSPGSALSAAVAL